MRSSGGMKFDRTLSKRRFTGAGASGDDNVQAADDARAQELCHFRRHRAEADQVLDRQFLLGELADGDRWTIDGARRNDRIDARTIGEARVHHRPLAVDASPQRTNNAVDNFQHMLIVGESHDVRVSLPFCSTYTERGPFTITSEMLSSRSSGSIGPNPNNSSITIS